MGSYFKYKEDAPFEEDAFEYSGSEVYNEGETMFNDECHKEDCQECEKVSHGQPKFKTLEELTEYYGRRVPARWHRDDKPVTRNFLGFVRN